MSTGFYIRLETDGSHDPTMAHVSEEIFDYFNKMKDTQEIKIHKNHFGVPTCLFVETGKKISDFMEEVACLPPMPIYRLKPV